MKFQTSVSVALVGLLLAGNALAVTSAEVYTGKGYQYGRFAARMQFAPGSGVVSSFFLWKDGSEQDDVFWNELDFEKLESVCRLETNTIFGDPEELDPRSTPWRSTCAMSITSTRTNGRRSTSLGASTVPKFDVLSVKQR